MMEICDNCGAPMNDNCRRCGANNTTHIVIVSAAPPWRGGIAKYIGDLAKSLASFRKIRIITFSHQWPNERENKSPELPTEMLLNPFVPATWFRTIKRIRELQPQTVIMKYWHPLYAPCFGFILRRVLARKIVIVDNVMPHDWFPLSRMLARYALSSADIFITHSSLVTDEIVKLFPCAYVKQFPHPVFEVKLSKTQKAEARKKLILGWPSDAKIVLFFGYVKPYKGLDTLIRAYAILQKRFGGKIMLVVAGEMRESWVKYQRLAFHDLGIVNGIYYTHSKSNGTGYVPDEKVELYFSAADLLVLPYKRATQSGVIELARNFRLPVIATNVGNLRDQIETVVPPNDPQALADAITDFFDFRRNCGYKPTISFDDLAVDMMEFCQETAERRFSHGMDSAAFFRTRAV